MEAFEQIAQFLSYLPQSVWHLPPRVNSQDPADRKDESLLSVIPRDRRQMYEVREVIAGIVDKDSFFEINAGYGCSLAIGLAHVHDARRFPSPKLLRVSRRRARHGHALLRGK